MMTIDFCNAFSSATYKGEKVSSINQQGWKDGTCLSLELLVDGHVGGERVFLGGHRHGCVVDSADRSGEVADRLGREFSLLGDRSRELASVILDVLEMSLDLLSEFLQVLDDRRLDGSCERRVRVGDDSRLVSDGVEHILSAERQRVASQYATRPSPAFHPRRGTGYLVGRGPG